MIDLWVFDCACLILLVWKKVFLPHKSNESVEIKQSAERNDIEPMIGPKKKRGRPPKDESRATSDGNPITSKKGTV